MNYSYQPFPSTPQCRVRKYFPSFCLPIVFVLLLTACGKQASDTTTIQGTNGAPVASLKGALNMVHMLNADIGWAEVMNLYAPSISFTVVRTTDGGSHWQTVLQCSPYQGVGKGAGFATCPEIGRAHV